MHATMRYYNGNPGLADQLAARADDIRALLRAVNGFQAYYLVQLDDATVSITVCDDEAGTAESTQVAAGWIRENMPDLAASPPMVSSGAVTLNA
jgi:3-methyladenine DNA glycosylase AlkD